MTLVQLLYPEKPLTAADADVLRAELTRLYGVASELRAQVAALRKECSEVREALGIPGPPGSALWQLTNGANEVATYIRRLLEAHGIPVTNPQPPA